MGKIKLGTHQFTTRNFRRSTKQLIMLIDDKICSIFSNMYPEHNLGNQQKSQKINPQTKK